MLIHIGSFSVFFCVLFSVVSFVSFFHHFISHSTFFCVIFRVFASFSVCVFFVVLIFHIFYLSVLYFSVFYLRFFVSIMVFCLIFCESISVFFTLESVSTFHLIFNWEVFNHSFMKNYHCFLICCEAQVSSFYTPTIILFSIVYL